MNKVSSPASVKSVCAPSKGDRLQSGIAVPRHRRRCNRQQRSAQAIAKRMNLAVRHDVPDGRERGFHAEPAIVVEGDVAIPCPRIAPGNHEYGKTFTGQELDQRVLRRQIEDVVFHDPCRHDQHRLRMHLAGSRVVLDQLDELIAKYDLAA